MCPPDHYDVIDVKNPYMSADTVVDRARAREQWEALKRTFLSIGLSVEVVPAKPGCEDMVFTANQALSGPNRVCVPGRLRHASRQREGASIRAWFERHGYEIRDSLAFFEGAGDAIWHPEQDRIWMGCGSRTESGALEGIFDAELIELELVDERFYHLDTCFCPLDRDTVLIHPPAFANCEPIHAHFRRILEVDPEEAVTALACNAASFFGTDVVIDLRAKKTIAQLRDRGYRVHGVDTGEFLKSGGSVYCLHNRL